MTEDKTAEKFTSQERALLGILRENPGILLYSDWLLESLDSLAGPELLSTVISRLRAKVPGLRVDSVRGKGYIFVGDASTGRNADGDI